MSLVVGYCASGLIKVVSDTRLFDTRSKLPCSHFDGALKILLLSADLGFAYAGEPTTALAFLREQIGRTLDFDTLSGMLFNKAKQSGGATDFLAFSLKPPQVRKIDSIGISNGQSQYWIGDADAFSVYQEAFHRSMTQYPEPCRQHHIYVANEMTSAMEDVIESQKVATVGDFLVPASSERGALHYVSHARITIFPTNERSSNGWFKMMGGTAEDGGYSLSMLTPFSPGIPAVAFHFREGRFGVLYCPAKLERPAIHRDLDASEFTQRVAETYGIKLQGQISIN